MAHLNPFRPQSPISRGMFVGRQPEIGRLESVLNHAKKRMPTNFMITGARGIGKTSLLLYLGALAKSYGDADDEGHNFLTANIVIEDQTSQIDLVKKIESSIRKELEKTDIARNFLNKTWEFLQRVEFAGFNIDSVPEFGAKNEGLLVEELGRSLIEIVDRTCNPGETDRLFDTTDYDGLLILVDEVDQASPALNVGRFLKYLTEYLHRHNCGKVTIGLSGLSSIVDILTQSHRSSLRVFEEIRLGALSEEETDNLIDICLDRGADKLSHRIKPDARQALNWLAEGHPHFLHQFGYCAFNSCIEGEQKLNENINPSSTPGPNQELARSFNYGGPVLITREHVLAGAFGNRGALELIGDMYFSDFYRSTVENKLGRRVIKCLCEAGRSGMTAEQIAGEIGEITRSVERILTDFSKSEHVSYDPFNDTHKIHFSCFAHWVQMKTDGITLDSDLFHAS